MVSENATEIAILGGGCFWCTEAVFKMMKGVSSVLPGYIGGTVPNPSYEQVSSGTTGHAEAVQVTYNPQLTTYNNLLTVFFGSHDPTTRPSADIDETSVVSEFLPRMEMPAKDTMPQASGNVGMGTADSDQTPVVSESLSSMEMPAKDTMPQASDNVGMGTA
ncbi:MAG: peptide-methionine (S)-S-oxide reductase, partial [Candidatus Taylorbacteria bacterium CG11_big_fil_rev_8_21_14_0_20_46_11]